MFTFDRKPQTSAARSPAPKPESQHPTKEPALNPLWVRGRAGSEADVEAVASPPVAPGPHFDLARISIMAPPVLSSADQSAAFGVTSSAIRPRSQFEEQADRFATEITRAPIARLDGPAAPLHAPTIAPTHPAAAAGADDPGLALSALGSPGQALDDATRAEMETRFQFDFSRVRVHTDGRADQAAAGLGALAFTFGSDIGFRSGQYAPATHAGRHLLAHELAHVLQQHDGPPVLQRKDAPQPGVRFKFALHVTAVISRDQLLLEFIKQYRRIPSDVEAIKVRDQEQWQWDGGMPTPTQNDVDKGYILINVTDRSITPSTQQEQDARNKAFGKLPASERDALNAEIYKEFWERSQYKVGQKLGTSPDDRELARDWLLLRDQLLRHRQAIEALPPSLKSFLLSGGQTAAVKPEDYEVVLRIAGKLASLTPVELAEYKSRTTAGTTDWKLFEQAIDRFLAERKTRGDITEERQKVSTRLAALEQVYKEYRAYQLSQKTGTFLAGSGMARGVGISLGSLLAESKQRQELTEKLARYGFKSIDEFQALIDRYEAAFQKESHALATVMLDQYEHLLFEQEERYKDPAASAALYNQLGPARQAYKEADQAYQDWRDQGGSAAVTSLDEMAHAARYTGIRYLALARGDVAVRSAAGSDPLVAGRDFNRETLARTPESGVQALMLDYIRARRNDIAETRKNLAESPEMVFVLDDLRAAAYKAQDIKPDSIYDLIVKDHTSDLNWKKAIPQVVLGVIAFAAGLLSGGTGAVAVMGAATAFWISSYQALETYHNYEVQHAAHGAQLLSKDPSFAWVVVAVVGAGLDLAVVGSTISSFRKPIEVFNASRQTAADVATLEKALAGAEERVRQSVVRAAKAEAEATAAWAEARATAHEVFPPGLSGMGEAKTTGSSMHAVFPSLPGMLVALAQKYAYPIFLSIKRLGRDFQVFLRSREFIELAGDASKLSPEELTALKGVFEQIVEEWGQVAKYGEKLGMTEAEASAFMKLHVQSRTTTVEDVMKQMDVWNVAKGEAQQAVETGGKLGKPFGFTDTEQFAKFRETAQATLKKAMKKIDPKTEAYLQGSSVSGLSFKRKVPFDAESDLDIAVTSRELMKKAERELGLEVKPNPRHIGPLEWPRDEKAIRELGLNNMRKELLELFPPEGGAARKINFMLFDNVEAATKPLGGGAGEAVRPVIPLKGD